MIMWIFDCVNFSWCEYIIMWIMRIDDYVIIWLHEKTSVWISDYVNRWFCEYMWIWLCEYICTFTVIYSRNQLLYACEPEKLNHFAVQKAQKDFSAYPPTDVKPDQFHPILADFGVCFTHTSLVDISHATLHYTTDGRCTWRTQATAIGYTRTPTVLPSWPWRKQHAHATCPTHTT